MLLVLAWKPIGMQPQSMTIKAQQAIGFMLPPQQGLWASLRHAQSGPDGVYPRR